MALVSQFPCVVCGIVTCIMDTVHDWFEYA